MESFASPFFKLTYKQIKLVRWWFKKTFGLDLATWIAQDWFNNPRGSRSCCKIIILAWLWIEVGVLESLAPSIHDHRPSHSIPSLVFHTQSIPKSLPRNIETHHEKRKFLSSKNISLSTSKLGIPPHFSIDQDAKMKVLEGSINPNSSYSSNLTTKLGSCNKCLYKRCKNIFYLLSLFGTA